MANYFDPYDPIFYAQEALIVLENALGMARRVHRGYDEERKSAEKGSTIEIRKPGRLVSQEGGTGTVQDLNPEKTNIVLDDWREVKFGLTDKELAYTGDRIIAEHISPATYELANYIETKLTGLYNQVGYSYDIDGTPDSADIVNSRKIVRDNAGGLVDSAMLHFGIDSTIEAAFLNNTIFHAANIAGESQNKDALLRGHLATRFGAEIFVQQTLSNHVGGTIVAGDGDGTLSADADERATTVSVTGLEAAGTIKAGDSFVIAGSTQRYVVTADATLAAGAGTLSIFPKIKPPVGSSAYASGSAITFETAGASNFSDAYDYSLMFHRNAFALAMAPLPQIGSGAGARMASILDPRTGLAMRSRVAYDDTYAKVKVTLDVLFGVKCLDPNLAVVVRRDS